VAAQGQRRSSRSWVRRLGSGQAPGDGEQPQAQRLVSATRSGADNDSVLGPAEQVAGEKNDGQRPALDAASWSGRLAKASVFGAADAAFGAGGGAAVSGRAVARRWCWWRSHFP
jgi:hypothetical protein